MSVVGLKRQDDPGYLEAIAEDIVRSSGSLALSRAFEGQGYAAPTLVWSPKLASLNNPKLVGFANALDLMKQYKGRLKASDLDINLLAHVSHWLMLLDVEDDGHAFRYCHYGKAVEEMRGLSMYGRTTDYFSGHISRFFTSSYRAVVLRKERMFSIHEPPRRVFVTAWKRLIVPLFDDDVENVVQIAVVNVPDNDLRAGLEVVPDPVLISDADGVVRYANRPAREMFRQDAEFGARLDLFDYAGIDLHMADSPAELADRGAIRDVVCLTLCGRMIQRYLLTVSGLVMNGRAFYVITLRPAIE